MLVPAPFLVWGMSCSRGSQLLVRTSLEILASSASAAFDTDWKLASSWTLMASRRFSLASWRDGRREWVQVRHAGGNLQLPASGSRAEVAMGRS